MEGNRVKRYVTVMVEFTASGDVLPRQISMQGKQFLVEDARVSDQTKMFSGGRDITRYKIRVKKRETFLYREKDRWFVEAKQ